jgi:hypothetical protein
MQVFEKVEVSIKVKEGRAGTRRLVIGFVHNGRDFGEPAGKYVSHSVRYTFNKVFIHLLIYCIGLYYFL